MKSERSTAESGALRARIEQLIIPLHGWTTVDKGVRLAELVVETGADVSVEIGVFGGRGTISMALGHRVIGRGRVAAVDPWEVAASLDGQNHPANDEWWAKVDHDAIYEGFVRALAEYDLIRQCLIMRERSDTAVRLFADESISVLHQDGNHSEKVSSSEVVLWAPKLRPGGYWVVDDSDWETTRLAQRLLLDRGYTSVEDHDAWRIFQKP